MSHRFIIVIFFFVSVGNIWSQIEQPVRLANCDQKDVVAVENCFTEHITNLFQTNFQLPEKLQQDAYATDFSVVFLATKKGSFEVLYVSPPNALLSKEVDRVFTTFPTFQPATYNQHSIDKQYILPYSFGKSNEEVVVEKLPLVKKKVKKQPIVLDNSKFKSTLQIPLAHANYQNLSQFEFGNNTHTAVKPYTYANVSQFVDFDTNQKNLSKDKTSWLGRKFWNENMLIVEGDNYWFHLDPIADLQLGNFRWC